MKTRIFTWLITAGAFLEVAYTVITDNAGILAELGVSPKVTKVVMLVGLLWNAFSKSLKEPHTPKTVVATEEENNGIGLPIPPKK
jgi:hypothetical protein